MIGLQSNFGLALVASLVAAIFGLLVIPIIIARTPPGSRITGSVRWLALVSVVVAVTATATPETWPLYRDGFGDLMLRPGDDFFGLWRGALADPTALASILLVANLVLYVPIGLFTSLATTWRIAVLTSVTLSVTVEMVQFTFLSRIASIDDILTNVAGGVIGVGLAATVSPRRPRQRGDQL